jgi:hypothetical protein
MDNPESLPKLGTRDTGQAETKSNRLIVERDKIDTPKSQIPDRLFFCLSTGASMKKSGGAKLNVTELLIMFERVIESQYKLVDLIPFDLLT